VSDEKKPSQQQLADPMARALSDVAKALEGLKPAEPVNQKEAAYGRYEQNALRIYEGLLPLYRGRDLKVLAEEAFARAAPFTEAGEEMRKRFFAGDKLPEQRLGVESPIIMVKVPVYEFDANSNSYVHAHEKDRQGEPTEALAYEMVQGDMDGFAPNMEVGHPLNLRHKLAREAVGRKAEWEERPFDKLTGKGVREPKAYKQAVN
jgi:hypothetical protein